MRGERKRTWREEDDGRLGEETLRNILSKSLPRIVFCFVFDNLWFSLSLSLSFFLEYIDAAANLIVIVIDQEEP